MNISLLLCLLTRNILFLPTLFPLNKLYVIHFIPKQTFHLNYISYKYKESRVLFVIPFVRKKQRLILTTIYTERLGHKSIEITANMYFLIIPKIIENEQGKYDAYVG